VKIQLPPLFSLRREKGCPPPLRGGDEGEGEKSSLTRQWLQPLQRERDVKDEA